MESKDVRWYQLPLKKVFEELKSAPEGLTMREAEYRLQTHGKNILPQERPYSRLRLLFSQFNNPLVYILLVAIIIAFSLKHYTDSIFVIVVLLSNTLVGYYQENKANQSIQKLKELVKINVIVYRDGHEREMNSEVIVPGDVIVLKPGDKVPADARIISSKYLLINEANLTGEWLASKKNPEKIKDDVAPQERKNMVFMGTVVEDGTGVAIVTETGIRTEIGNIVTLLRETQEDKTPLQKKLASLSRLVGAFILGVVALIVIIGVLRGDSFADIFVASLALAVSAIPEGLLPAITVILVLGMRRILKQNGLVRKLIANETLGGVTVICTDKTGTITEGRMRVSGIFTDVGGGIIEEGTDFADHKNEESHLLALKISMMTNDAFIENPDDSAENWVIRGKPTEQALLIAGTEAGFDRRALDKEYPLLDQMSFNQVKKFSASLRKKNPTISTVHLLGAPEELIAKSTHVYSDGKTTPLTGPKSKKIIENLEYLASKGLRVVGCAYRDISVDHKYKDLDELLGYMTIVGFIALRDPLRKDAKDTITTTQRAGIRTVIITGDHRLTAQTIAREAGLSVLDDNILEGNELEKMDDRILQERAKTTIVYARVLPKHKKRIVQALQASSEIVAMIGDGVNDAPALKAADIGIAVGSGTDIAKEVSDIILLDNSLGTVVKATEQGRVIFENIRKVFVYLVCDDFPQVFVFLASVIMGLPLPLLPAQILWINIVEDGLPDLALTTEQEVSGIMERPPRNPKAPFLDKSLAKYMFTLFWVSGLFAFGLLLFLDSQYEDVNRIRTILFVFLSVYSLIFSLSLRRFRMHMFRWDIFSNYFLTGAIGISTLILLAALYLPPLQHLLKTQPLTLFEWGLVVGLAIAELAITDTVKTAIMRRA